MKNSFYKFVRWSTAIALCVVGVSGEARAQAERASSPLPSTQVPNDPLKPIPQTNKPLINDVELRDRQQPTPPNTEEANAEEAIPSSLAKALSRALRSNPDVLLAIARLDEVRAERDRMRLKVVEQVSQAIHDIEANRDEHYSLRRRRADKTAPEQGKSEGTLQAELAGIWSHLGYLLGAGVDEEPSDAKGRTSAEELAQSLSGDLTNALTRALRSNPDLRLAESKVREAQAELSQTKLATVRKLTVAFHRWQNGKQTLESREAAYASGTAQMEHVVPARQAAAESEAELLYLLGASGDTEADRPAREVPTAPLEVPQPRPVQSQRPSLPDKLNESLGKKVSSTFHDTTLSEALKELSSQCGVQIVTPTLLARLPVNLSGGGEVSVFSILEMLADQTECAFIVRDYGLFTVRRNEAWQYPGAAVPSDAPSSPDGGVKGR